MAKINIKLSYENGPVTIFNIKKSQEINKVVKLFAERKNMDMKDWVYQVNGRMIQLENESEEAQTAESLGELKIFIRNFVSGLIFILKVT